jgi:hypothetical protein
VKVIGVANLNRGASKPTFTSFDLVSTANLPLGSIHVVIDTEGGIHGLYLEKVIR